MANDHDMHTSQPQFDRFREPIYDITQDTTGDNIYWVAYGLDGKPLPAGLSAPMSRVLGYDADGTVLTKYNFDAAGTLVESFRYHKNGWKETSTQYNPDGSTAYTHEHYASGEVKTTLRFENGQPAYMWEYDRFGKVVNEQPYNEPSQPPKQTTSRQNDTQPSEQPRHDIKRSPDGLPIYRSLYDERTSQDIDWVQIDRNEQPMEPGTTGQVECAFGYGSQDRKIGRDLTYSSVYTYDENDKLLSQRRYDMRFGKAAAYLCAQFDYRSNGSVEHAYEYYAGSGAVKDTFYDKDGKPLIAFENRPQGPIRCYEYSQGRVTVHTIGRQEHEGVMDAYRAYVGNPHLQPHGFNPFGALNPDGSLMYGFGYNPDTGTVWNSGYTSQGDPRYDLGYGPTGDPLYPIDPSNR